VSNNADSSGSAVHIKDVNGSLVNCSFINNDCCGCGGAIGFEVENNESTVYLMDCLFGINSAPKGGGIHVMNGCLIINTTSFMYNHASLAGGGIYFNSSAGLQIHQSTFVKNFVGGENDGVACVEVEDEGVERSAGNGRGGGGGEGRGGGGGEAVFIENAKKLTSYLLQDVVFLLNGERNGCGLL
jgi:predicted outer membrane repeat protein